jgi:hypothetical protein
MVGRKGRTYAPVLSVMKLRREMMIIVDVE